MLTVNTQLQQQCDLYQQAYITSTHTAKYDANNTAPSNYCMSTCLYFSTTTKNICPVISKNHAFTLQLSILISVGGSLPSALWHWWLGVRKSIWPVKIVSEGGLTVIAIAAKWRTRSTVRFETDLEKYNFWNYKIPVTLTLDRVQIISACTVLMTLSAHLTTWL